MSIVVQDLKNLDIYFVKNLLVDFQKTRNEILDEEIRLDVIKNYKKLNVFSKEGLFIKKLLIDNNFYN
jgi:hypothetical protein